MGIRNSISNFIYKQLEKRGIVEDISQSISMFGSKYVDDDSILESSDVYELLQDISNQIAMAELSVIDCGKDIPLKEYMKSSKPNSYLTFYEYMKLMTNTYLLDGEVFPVLICNELHIATSVQSELTERLTEKFAVGGINFPSSMIRHVKNIGTSHLKGVGIIKLGKFTLEGVLNAEKILTDKYKKGGLLAFLLKLDAHINPNNAAQSKLVKTILEQLKGTTDDKNIKLIPLGKGYEIGTLASPIDDEKILKYLNVYKKDLGKFLCINVDTYQELMKVDPEKAMMYLHNKAVKPIIRNFEEHLTLLFFGKKSKKRIAIKINMLDFVNSQTKTNIAYNLVRTMIFTPDDAREMLGQKRLNTEESSTLKISKDLINADDLALVKGGDEDKKARK